MTPTILFEGDKPIAAFGAGFEQGEIAKLQALGHTVQNPGNIGNVNAVFIDPQTGRQFGAVDTTREGGLIGLPLPPSKGHDNGKGNDGKAAP